jgi:hypothetical protein
MAGTINSVNATNYTDFNQSAIQVNNDNKITDNTESVSQDASAASKLAGLNTLGETTKNRLDGQLLATNTTTAKDDAEIKKAVKEFQAYTPGASTITLAKALKGKSPEYQAKLINSLIKELPTNRVMNFFANSSGDKTVANALSNAYNYEAKNGRGGAFLQNIVKKAATSGVGNADKISRLVSSTGNEKMIGEYITQSKVYSAGLKGTDSASNAARSNADTSGATVASSGSAATFIKSLRAGTMTDDSLKTILKTEAGQKDLAKILDKLKNDKDGLGTTLFLRMAKLSEKITSPTLKNSMVSHFNEKAVDVTKRLSDGKSGFDTAKSLSEFFKSAMGENRLGDISKGIGTIVAKSISNAKGSPQTSGIALQNFVASIQTATENYKGDYDKVKSGWSSVLAAGLGTAAAMLGIPFDVPTIVSTLTGEIADGANKTKNEVAAGLANRVRQEIHVLIDQSVNKGEISTDFRQKLTTYFQRPNTLN